MNSTLISRRKFLTIAGSTTTAFLVSSQIQATERNNPAIRFGMISDVHYADREPVGSRFYRQSLEKVKEFIDLMNREKVEFVIELGDFKDQDALPNETNTLKYLETIEDAFQQFNGPTFHVLGNHDMDGISKEQFLSRVVNTSIPVSESYYSFNQNGFHFVVLDANFTAESLPYNHGNFSWENAVIPEQQLKWLDRDLKANILPVIVFIHQLLDDSKTKVHSVQNAGQVRQILEQAGNVICVFQGHVHEESHQIINHIHYYSLFATVDKEGPVNNSYTIVELYKDKSIAIKGFRRATDRQFAKEK